MALAAPLMAYAAPAGTVINDVTQLNPILVESVLAPTSIAEIVDAVKTHQGPISVGGGRFSMGGQTATEQALQIDMRQSDRVVRFSKENKEITVQTGITWRKILEYIDPHDLSLQIMQSYANFTVGGSLSVNVHGRYVGQGPLIHAVKSIRIVLADGSLVTASPTENQAIFYGAIGGYGGIGVIVGATLKLTDNVKVARRSEMMPTTAYRSYFFKQVRDNPGIIFHNADFTLGAYDSVRATSYDKTDKPVTIADRLMPKDKDYSLQRNALWMLSEWPFGPFLRNQVLDPFQYRGTPVEWRNYEASYDVRELEPESRKDSTYVLQEYFVPVDKFDAFVPKMADILNRHHVNVTNVSIRHAKKDPGTLLAWARNEVFAYVLYYRQGTSPAARQAVGVWTRELIDVATALDGAYYLPYQILATSRQFRAAYPQADAFFALKQRLDPTNKFRNKLWDAYYQPVSATVPADAVPAPTQVAPAGGPGPEIAPETRAYLQSLPGYQRDEAQTYLTLPEWLLVFGPDDYAHWVQAKAPSGYPYFGAIGQFWSYYGDVCTSTKAKYPFNFGYHAMVMVIGSSFTVENAIKGLYEGTIGQVTERLGRGGMSAEDAFGAKVAQEYVDFIRVEPWYEFPFANRLKRLWGETSLTGPDMLRKWERRLTLSLEYAVKAQYALLIKAGTKLAYGEEDTHVLALASNVTPAAVSAIPQAKIVRQFPDGTTLLSLPRYEAFHKSVTSLVNAGGMFQEIAGNGTILVTSIVPAAWRYDLAAGQVLFDKPILSDPALKRVTIAAPVEALHQIVLGLGERHFPIEHIFDY
ncbi:MAG: FAD-dependent oxidoreductase [Candidatus Sericytochromatia bacterium]|nr:FAD-dependent oxidoreductase [Candidatus Sericytochromatia bacterium]